jgi:hypothetical protein
MSESRFLNPDFPNLSSIPIPIVHSDRSFGARPAIATFSAPPHIRQPTKSLTMTPPKIEEVDDADDMPELEEDTAGTAVPDMGAEAGSFPPQNGCRGRLGRDQIVFS